MWPVLTRWLHAIIDCALLLRVDAFGNLIRSMKPITDARLGQNEPRALRIRFDLSPQLPDVDPKVLRVDIFVPKLTAQNFLRHHRTGVLH
jgi:hypothetical protein